MYRRPRLIEGQEDGVTRETMVNILEVSQRKPDVKTWDKLWELLFPDDTNHEHPSRGKSTASFTATIPYLCMDLDPSTPYRHRTQLTKSRLRI